MASCVGDKGRTMWWDAGTELRLVMLTDSGLSSCTTSTVTCATLLSSFILLSLHDMLSVCNVYLAWLTQVRAKPAAGPMNPPMRCLCPVVFTGRRLDNELFD